MQNWGLWAGVSSRASLVLVALACGSDSDGDGDGALCTTFTPCGGDPTGTWQLRDICLPDGFASDLIPDLPTECASAIVVDDVTSDATLTIGADGTGSQTGTVTVDWTFAFNQPCISAVAEQPADDAIIEVFCDGFLDSISTDPDATFADASCGVANATCSCDARQELDVAGAGQYSISGDTIDNGDGPLEFCVQGDQLTIALGSDPGLEGAHQVYVRSSP